MQSAHFHDMVAREEVAKRGCTHGCPLASQILRTIRDVHAIPLREAVAAGCAILQRFECRLIREIARGSQRRLDAAAQFALTVHSPPPWSWMIHERDVWFLAK